MTKRKKLPQEIAVRVENLPRGVVVSDLWAAKGERTGRRWYFRVRDPLRCDAKGRPVYQAQAWADFAEGESWAIKESAKTTLGLSSAGSAKMSELGPAYVKTLAARGRTERYQGTVTQVWKAMVAAGADDLKDPLLPQRVDAWLSALKARRFNQRKPTPASNVLKNQFRVVINAIIAHAMAQQDSPLIKDPLASVKAWPIDTKSRRVFTVEELRGLVSDKARLRPGLDYQKTVAAVAKADDDKQAAAKALKVSLATIYNRLNAGAPGDDPWWLYTALGIYTGARPTEVRNMAWEHIDWHNGDILLPADHPGNKTGVERRIPIFAELRAILEARRKPKSSGPILPKEIVEMREDTATRAFQSYVERCGFDSKGRGPHTLRHNCGALLTACGVQDVAVLLHLGHESVAVSKEYRRTAPAFRNDVKGWSGEIRLRKAKRT